MLLTFLTLLVLAAVLLLAIAAGCVWLVVLAVRHRHARPLPGRPRCSVGNW
jgi:hypothetical protein